MASSLHVVLYHPARLPVVRYGGTERVVVWLARGLAELGHRVTVLCGAGSAIPEAHVVPLPRAIIKRPGGADLTSVIPADTDVVHAHVPLQRPPEGVPFLWTYHGFGPLADWFPPNAIGLSTDHARRHGLTHWVYNGLDPAEYRFQPHKRGFDLFLGRLHSVKGWRWAMTGARRARHPLVIAGGWRPTVRRGLTFTGEVGGDRKVALLGDAACLWMPAQWDEPFGLTTIEAMVSGTPVLGTRRGALPEIVTAECGSLGDTLDELVELRPRLAALDPEAIRARVLADFTHRAMAAAYVDRYRATMGRG